MDKATKDEIIQKITEGKIKEALQCFLENIPENAEERSKIILFSSQWNGIAEQLKLGLLDFNQVKNEQTRITNATIEMVENYEAKPEDAEFKQAIASFPLDKDIKLGQYQTVNCDRRKPAKTFRTVFGKNLEKGDKFQFYFLYGCDNQLPASLAERLVYELMHEDDKELDAAVHYEYFESDGGIKRIKSEQLPLGYDVAGSKKKFKQYVQKRFNFADTESIESFLETGVPKLNYEYVVAIFDISEKKWRDDEGEILEYFEWMIQTIKTAHKDVPTFLFFFSIMMPNVHEESKQTRLQKQIIAELESLTEKHDTAIIGNITPIEDDDFSDWLSDLGAKNPNDRLELSQLLKVNLNDEDKQNFQTTGELHMKDVQPFQEKIVTTLKNRYKPAVSK